MKLHFPLYFRGDGNALFPEAKLHEGSKDRGIIDRGGILEFVKLEKIQAGQDICRDIQQKIILVFYEALAFLNANDNGNECFVIDRQVLFEAISVSSGCSYR